ncbi:hypothetical protein, partial [Achromobacter insolitus]|uniref:hypothetical protein n=1 Tax=Achromobacter insolitus TaxID=217204 RepID=UPI003B9D51F0
PSLNIFVAVEINQIRRNKPREIPQIITFITWTATWAESQVVSKYIKGFFLVRFNQNEKT